MKKFVGLYMLRKARPETNAYAIFGLSDSPHGYWLLSDAVSKDAENLQIADEAKKQAGLFDAEEREGYAQALMQRLVELAKPIILKQPKLSGAKLAVEMFRAGVGVQELFGRYQGKDFTAAAKRINEEIRGNNAETK